MLFSFPKQETLINNECKFYERSSWQKKDVSEAFVLPPWKMISLYKFPIKIFASLNVCTMAFNNTCQAMSRKMWRMSSNFALQKYSTKREILRGSETKSSFIGGEREDLDGFCVHSPQPEKVVSALMTRSDGLAGDQSFGLVGRDVQRYCE